MHLLLGALPTQELSLLQWLLHRVADQAGGEGDGTAKLRLHAKVLLSGGCFLDPTFLGVPTNGRLLCDAMQVKLISFTMTDKCGEHFMSLGHCRVR